MRRNLLVIVLGLVAVLAIASPVLGGPSLKSLVRKEVAKQLAGKTGPQGPPGVQGVTGPPGSPAAGVVFGRINSLTTSTDATEFGSPSGTSTPNATQGVVWMTSPSVDIVLSNFQFAISSTQGAAHRIFTVMVDNDPTGISCDFTGLGSNCSPGGSVNVPGGHFLSIRAQTGGVAPAFNDAVVFSYRATAP